MSRLVTVLISSLILLVLCVPRMLAQDGWYAVTLEPSAAIDDTGAGVAQLAATYGGKVIEGGIGGAAQGESFVVALSDSRAQLMAADPRVSSMASLVSRGTPENGIPESVSWSNGVSYTYDGSGNIRQIGTDHYVYDAANRLVQADLNGTRRNYEYDAFGNRTRCRHLAGTPSETDCQYGFQIDTTGNRNRLGGAGYDAAGNQTSLQGHAYSYDELNMMTRDQFGVQAREFIYTADDERIATYHVGSTWNWTVRETSGRVLREFVSYDGPSGPGTANWAWTKDYIWRDSLLLASRQPEGGAVSTYHYHLDHLGTPRRITNQTSRTVGSHDYYAFGPEASGGVNEPSLTRLKYTGHERDTWFGESVDTLDYMHARYYGGGLGRFLSVDPGKDWDMSQPQSWNLYSYVRNNPVGATDPSGKCGESADFVGPTLPCDAEIEVVAENPSDLEHLMWYTGETTAELTQFGPLPFMPSDPWTMWGMYQAEQNPTTPEIQNGVPIVGPFSIRSFPGYPSYLPKPSGPFRVLEGAEQATARTAANNANRALHRADPSLAGKQIHEIQPVKFGGSPTDPANKIPLTRQQHAQVTTWWSRFLRSLKDP